MGASASTLTGVRVVILGGGYAGVAVLKGLLGKVESLTLIEKSDRFYHNIGAPRALVQAGVENTIVLPYDRVLQGKARHVRGVASGVDTSAKTVAVRKLDGTTEAVPYDFLVVATGTSNSLPSKMLTQHSGEAAAALAQMRSAIAAARSVAIVGGGAVGVEVAGEIAVDFAGKTEVHLVHRGASLLSNPENGVLPQKFRDDVRRALEARKVHLHLSTTAAPVADVPTSVVSLNGGRILLGPVSMSLSDGSTLTPDVTLFTTGGRPNNAAFTSGPLSGALDAAGRLKVQPTLQVEGFADIFALGDIAGTTDSKLAYIAGSAHAPKVIKNVLTLAKAKALGAPAGKLLPHVPAPLGSMIVTFGRTGGAGYLAGSRLPAWLVKGLKSKDLLVGRYTKEMGYAKPGVFPGAASATLPPAGAAVAGAGATAIGVHA